MSDPKRHHFVPKLLLRPWLVEGNLHGYYWDKWRGKVACKARGLDAFCNRVDLLALKAAGLGRYDLERKFFSKVDDKGAKARDRLLSSGSLSMHQRRAFVHLLLSLEARRPFVVSKLRDEGTQSIRGELDNDPEILASLKDHGIIVTPSVYAEAARRICFEDRALGLIKGLVVNSQVEPFLIKAFWHLVHLGLHDGSLVLGDRPFVRINPFDKPGATWALPLTPKIAFVAVNHRANLERIKRVSAQRFAKAMNVSSARQAEHFVFSVDGRDQGWLGRYLQSQKKNVST